MSRRHLLIIAATLPLLCCFGEKYAIAQTNDSWTAPIRVQIGNHNFNLSFGVNPSATAGFDAGVDIMTAPPPPATPYAYFALQVFPNYLQADCRGPSNNIIWNLNIPNTAGATSTVSWDVSQVPTSVIALSLVSLNETVNMLQTTSKTYVGDQSLQIILNLAPLLVNAGNDASFCLGAATNLNGTASGGSGSYSFTWAVQSGPNNSSAQFNNPALEDPIFTPTLAGDYVLRLTVNDGASPAAFDEVTITVKALPTASVSGSTSICVGGSSTISAALTGSPPWNLTWSDGLVQNGVANSPATRSVSPSSITTYTVTAVADANCTGTSSGSATVTINPSSVVANAGADLATTAGVSAKIGANPTANGGTGALTINWSPSTGLNSTTVSNPTATPSSTTTYTVTVTDANGCTATDQVTVRAGNLVNSRIKAVIGPTNLYDPVLNQVRTDIAIKNISSQPIYGPLTAVFKTLTPGPPTITIGNANGGGAGLGSYYDYSNLLGSDNILSPGETTGYKLWIFQENVRPAVSFKFFADIIGDLDGIPKAADSRQDQPLAFSFEVQKGVVEDNSDSKLADGGSEIPERYAIHQNNPNPFNPSTMIGFALPKAGYVRVKIFNTTGQEIRTLANASFEAGYQTLRWDGRDHSGNAVAAGIYLYQIIASGANGEVKFKETKRMTFVK